MRVSAESQGRERAGRVGENVSEDITVARKTRSRRGPLWKSKTKHEWNKQNKKRQNKQNHPHMVTHMGSQGNGDPNLYVRKKVEAGQTSAERWGAALAKTHIQGFILSSPPTPCLLCMLVFIKLREWSVMVWNFYNIIPPSMTGTIECK